MILSEWIEKHQIDDSHDYSKGWNELMYFVFELQSEFGNYEFEVIGSYKMLTPPPSSRIIMPVFMAKSKFQKLIFKESWVIEPDWVVSIETSSKLNINIKPLIEEVDLERKWIFDGFEEKYIMALFLPDLRSLHVV
jgi:hypothetical protein